MTLIWIYTLLSVLLISLISLIGIITLAIKKKFLKKIVSFLVSFSAGALLGGAFLHLLPETVEKFGFTMQIGIFILIGILIFFILEKFIHWRHCHHLDFCEEHDAHRHSHAIAYMNLVGDSVHNLIDGMIIAGSYLLSIPIGIATTVAVIFHEIPQEIGDFGVLIHGGLSRKKAILYNFLTALTAIIGAVLVLLINNVFDNMAHILLPLAAGGFIYIAGSDLIPELHKEHKPAKSLFQIIGILLGIGVMLALLTLG